MKNPMVRDVTDQRVILNMRNGKTGDYAELCIGKNSDEKSFYAVPGGRRFSKLAEAVATGSKWFRAAGFSPINGAVR